MNRLAEAWLLDGDWDRITRVTDASESEGDLIVGAHDFRFPGHWARTEREAQALLRAHLTAKASRSRCDLLAVEVKLAALPETP